MDIPPDIKAPARLTQMILVSRWEKRRERLALELTHAFNRTARRKALVEFEERWLIQEREDVALRLAAREFFEKYGPTRTLQIGSLRYLPKDMAARSRIYQLHAQFEQSVEQHRRKLGLPPRDLELPHP